MWRELPNVRVEKKSAEHCHVSGCHGFNFRSRWIASKQIKRCWEEQSLSKQFWLPCDQKCYITVFFSGLNFGITWHSLYRKYFSAEIIFLYITLSWPQPLSCTSVMFHYITWKNWKQINSAMHYIMVTLQIVFEIWNVIISGRPVSTSTLHSLYRKHFSAEIILLYITLSWPQPLSCTSVMFHYITWKMWKRFSSAIHYIMLTLKIVFRI